MRALQMLGAMGLVLLSAIDGRVISSPPDDPTDATSQPPAITISKETTFVTGPLTKDGYVNYREALNERMSRRVTAENNAAVLLIRALGPAPEGRRLPDKLFKRLGIERPREKGEYLVYLERFAENEAASGVVPKPVDTEKLFEQWYKTMDRPWTAKNAPTIARWLQANERPLALVAEAVERPRYFNPWTSDDESKLLLNQPIPHIQHYREFARQLKTRAMLRLGEGDMEGAWKDLLTLHRLARLISQGPVLVDSLIGISSDGMACGGDWALATCGMLTARQAMRMQRELSDLPPIPSVADILDGGERMMMLDLMQSRPTADDFGKAVGAADHTVDALKTLMALGEFEWDEVLRTGNRWMDRLVLAARKPTIAQRKAALAEIEESTIKVREFIFELPRLARSFPMDIRQPKKWIGERIGDVIAISFMSVANAVIAAEQRATTSIDMTQVTFALGAYRADHKHYPDSLDLLTPDYITEIPRDVFGAALRYDSDDAEFTLIGAGQKDFEFTINTPGRIMEE